jgi:hypothetical protein
MSWGTCYAGSNNIHLDFPPIMHDGRNYANWQPGSVINDSIKKEANIKSNWEYRRYLCNNADTIIKINQINACGDCCANTAQYKSATNGATNGATNDATLQTSNNSPYLFKSCMDIARPIGYENSDLKNMYLSDVNLQSRMVTPVFSQAELISNGLPRAN